MMKKQKKTPPSLLLCLGLKLRPFHMGLTVFFHRGFFLASTGVQFPLFSFEFSSPIPVLTPY